ncbi:hypothetical protein LPJ73_003385 [Coemansia sp. RSA 2703]|nr:hypothetical protein LPJ73_003385 [Coemansia sp. RSA 2703]
MPSAPKSITDEVSIVEKSEAKPEEASAEVEAAGDDKVVAPAKKQRLSLEDYKRRRVNNVATPSKEIDAKETESKSGAGETETEASNTGDQAPTNRAKVSLEEYNRRRKASGSYTGELDNGSSVGTVKGALLAEPVLAKAITETDKTASAVNGSISAPSLSPIAPSAQPENSGKHAGSVVGSLSIPSRLVRSPAQPISAPLPIKPGDVSGRRRILSPPPLPVSTSVGGRTDERLNGTHNRDRERRHNSTFSGSSGGPSGGYHGYGHGSHSAFGHHTSQQAPPARSSTPHGSDGGRGGPQRAGNDWRSSSSSSYAPQRMSPAPASYGNGGRAMTMSPDSVPGPGSDSYHRSSGTGSTNPRRAGGLGSTTGSRGGSPLRK